MFICECWIGQQQPDMDMDAAIAMSLNSNSFDVALGVRSHSTSFFFDLLHFNTHLIFVLFSFFFFQAAVYDQEDDEIQRAIELSHQHK
jgi:hypothetical protein